MGDIQGFSENFTSPEYLGNTWGILGEYLGEIFFLDCLVPIYSYAIRLGIKKAVTHLRGTWNRRIVIGGDHLESHGLEQTG